MAVKGSVKTLLSRVCPHGSRDGLANVGDADGALCQGSIGAVGVRRERHSNIGDNDRAERAQQSKLLSSLARKGDQVRALRVFSTAVGHAKERPQAGAKTTPIQENRSPTTGQGRGEFLGKAGQRGTEEAEVAECKPLLRGRADKDLSFRDGLELGVYVSASRSKAEAAEHILVGGAGDSLGIIGAFGCVDGKGGPRPAQCSGKVPRLRRERRKELTGQGKIIVYYKPVPKTALGHRRASEDPGGILEEPRLGQQAFVPGCRVFDPSVVPLEERGESPEELSRLGAGEQRPGKVRGVALKASRGEIVVTEGRADPIGAGPGRSNLYLVIKVSPVSGRSHQDVGIPRHRDVGENLTRRQKPRGPAEATL